MRYFLLMIAAVALVACGKKTTPAEPETNAESKAAGKKQEPAKGEPKAAGKKPTPPKALTNTLGMKFVPVSGTEVAFFIWETRVKDYAAYAAANERWKYPGFKQTGEHPVVNVSWNDAQEFCGWLTKKELAEGEIKAGQKCRLPTDAEWSVAVGLGKEKGNTPGEKDMGVKDAYPWGNQWWPPKGAGNYLVSLKVDNFEYTSPVGSFAANKFGLHDMGGNVWEWCEDKWNTTSTYWVLRGASWDTPIPPRWCRPVATTSRPIFTAATSVFGVCWRVVPVGEVGFVTLSPCPLEP
jgi:formylglycine-generating enzyme required for sulfatase activity